MGHHLVEVYTTEDSTMAKERQGTMLQDKVDGILEGYV